MAVEYCNLTSDLKDAFSLIETNYRGLDTLEDWEATSTSNVYKLDQSGYVETVFENGVALTASDPATTSPAAGEFSYDASSDILYLHCTGSVDPAQKTLEGGYDWNTLKQRCRNDAQELLESLLKSVFAVPFQKIAAPNVSYNSRKYPFLIRKCTALLTCALIVKKVNPSDKEYDRLYRQVDNPNTGIEEGLDPLPGIVQRILAGEMSIQTQTVAREAGGWNVFETLDASSTAILEVTGRYTGPQRQLWRVQIDLAGAPGTATYQLSKDGGATFDETGQETRTANSDDQRVSLGSGLYVRFSGTAVLNDYWDLDLLPSTDAVTVKTMGNVRLVR